MCSSSITGDDLRRAGVPESPRIGAALKETLALKLDGVVNGRDEELATALRWPPSRRLLRPGASDT